MPTTTTLRRSAFLVTLLLSTAASAQVAPRRDGRAFAADSFWIRKWLRGGSREEDLLTEPRQVIVAGNMVVVLDEGTREVFAFDIATGQTRLNMKALGEGPGEFRRPARIVPTTSGFAVLDHATARLTAFDSLGRMQWDAPLVGAIGTEGLCVLTSGHLIRKVEGAVGSIVRSDTAGRQLGRNSLGTLADSSASYEWSGLVSGPDAAGNCVVARRYGANWYVVSPTGGVTSHEYVVHSAEPQVHVTMKRGKKIGTKQIVERTQTIESAASTMDAMVLADTLIVRASGIGRERLALLDYYHVPTGRYLHSRRLPLIPNALAIGSDGVFYALTIGEESATVYAIRTSSKPTARTSPRQPPKLGH